MMITTLPAGPHAIYRLADDLLLVFKPAGHREPEHAHDDGQRLRVLRGRLRVERAAAAVVLDATSEPLVLAPGEPHTTEAFADTWVAAERASAPHSHE